MTTVILFFKFYYGHILPVPALLLNKTFLCGFTFYFFKDFTYLLLERGEGREKERKRNISWLPFTRPQLGTWPSTQACALMGN